MKEGKGKGRGRKDGSGEGKLMTEHTRLILKLVSY